MNMKIVLVFCITLVGYVSCNCGIPRRKPDPPEKLKEEYLDMVLRRNGRLDEPYRRPFCTEEEQVLWLFRGVLATMPSDLRSKMLDARQKGLPWEPYEAQMKEKKVTPVMPKPVRCGLMRRKQKPNKQVMEDYLDVVIQNEERLVRPPCRPFCVEEEQIMWLLRGKLETMSSQLKSDILEARRNKQPWMKLLRSNKKTPEKPMVDRRKEKVPMSKPEGSEESMTTPYVRATTLRPTTTRKPTTFMRGIVISSTTAATTTPVPTTRGTMANNTGDMKSGGEAGVKEFLPMVTTLSPGEEMTTPGTGVRFGEDDATPTTLPPTDKSSTTDAKMSTSSMTEPTTTMGPLATLKPGRSGGSPGVGTRFGEDDVTPTVSPATNDSSTTDGKMSTSSITEPTTIGLSTTLKPGPSGGLPDIGTRFGEDDTTSTISPASNGSSTVDTMMMSTSVMTEPTTLGSSTTLKPSTLEDLPGIKRRFGEDDVTPTVSPASNDSSTTDAKMSTSSMTEPTTVESSTTLKPSTLEDLPGIKRRFGDDTTSTISPASNGSSTIDTMMMSTSVMTEPTTTMGSSTTLKPSTLEGLPGIKRRFGEDDVTRTVSPASNDSSTTDAEVSTFSMTEPTTMGPLTTLSTLSPPSNESSTTDTMVMSNSSITEPTTLGSSTTLKPRTAEGLPEVGTRFGEDDVTSTLSPLTNGSSTIDTIMSSSAITDTTTMSPSTTISTLSPASNESSTIDTMMMSTSVMTEPTTTMGSSTTLKPGTSGGLPDIGTRFGEDDVTSTTSSPTHDSSTIDAKISTPSITEPTTTMGLSTTLKPGTSGGLPDIGTRFGEDDTTATIMPSSNGSSTINTLMSTFAMTEPTTMGPSTTLSTLSPASNESSTTDTMMMSTLSLNETTFMGSSTTLKPGSSEGLPGVGTRFGEDDVTPTVSPASNDSSTIDAKISTPSITEPTTTMGLSTTLKPGPSRGLPDIGTRFGEDDTTSTISPASNGSSTLDTMMMSTSVMTEPTTTMGSSTTLKPGTSEGLPGVGTRFGEDDVTSTVSPPTNDSSTTDGKISTSPMTELTTIIGLSTTLKPGPSGGLPDIGTRFGEDDVTPTVSPASNDSSTTDAKMSTSSMTEPTTVGSSTTLKPGTLKGLPGVGTRFGEDDVTPTASPAFNGSSTIDTMMMSTFLITEPTTTMGSSTTLKPRTSEGLPGVGTRFGEDDVTFPSPPPTNDSSTTDGKMSTSSITEPTTIGLSTTLKPDPSGGSPDIGTRFEEDVTPTVSSATNGSTPIVTMMSTFATNDSTTPESSTTNSTTISPLITSTTNTLFTTVIPLLMGISPSSASTSRHHLSESSDIETSPTTPSDPVYMTDNSTSTTKASYATDTTSSTVATSTLMNTSPTLSPITNMTDTSSTTSRIADITDTTVTPSETTTEASKTPTLPADLCFDPSEFYDLAGNSIDIPMHMMKMKKPGCKR